LASGSGVIVRHVAERRQEESSRPHALDIYERVCEDTAEELSRPQGSLFFSALFAGLTIGLAPLAVALITVSLGEETRSTAFVASLFYPIGYIAVIVGRSQFFTENTLYPVMLTLRQREYINRTGRLWLIVLSMNLVGAFIFAALAVWSGALESPVQDALVKAGVTYTDGDLGNQFSAGVATGFLLALIAWLVEGSDTVTGRIGVIWGLAFFVSLGSFDHCIASTITVFAAILEGDLGIGEALAWFAPVLAGNIVGGVAIVAAINYGQVREED
jgi:formate/nitrite transporter FocA (FNT family)